MKLTRAEYLEACDHIADRQWMWPDDPTDPLVAKLIAMGVLVWEECDIYMVRDIEAEDVEAP